MMDWFYGKDNAPDDRREAIAQAVAWITAGVVVIGGLWVCMGLYVAGII